MARILLLLLALSVCKATAAQPINIALREEFLLSELYAEILTEAYHRAGIAVNFVYFPGGSSLNLSNKQTLGIDGEAGRLAAVLGKYSNLVKLDTPIYQSHIAIFTQAGASPIDGWDALRGKNVTTRLGFKVVIDNLNQFGIEYRAVESTEQAMRMLAKGYTDAVVVNRMDGLLTLKDLEFDNLVLQPDSLLVLPVFHLLHRSREQTIAGVAEALKQMATEGRIAALTQAFFERQAVVIELPR